MSSDMNANLKRLPFEFRHQTYGANKCFVLLRYNENRVFCHITLVSQTTTAEMTIAAPIRFN